MENVRIEVFVQNTAKDYRRVALQLYRKVWVIAGVLYLLIVPLMLWLAVFGAGANPFEEKNYSIISIMILFAILPVVMAAGIIFNLFRRADNVAKKTEPSVFAFDDKAVEVKATSYAFKLGWEHFIKVRELSQDLVLYQSQNNYFSIPKRSFDDESKLDAFRGMLRNKLGSKATLNNY